MIKYFPICIFMSLSLLLGKTPTETYTLTNEMSFRVSHITNRAYSSPRLFFDKNNRMHVALVASDSTGSNLNARPRFTHVIYACSDDGGETFKRADGSEYNTMPINLVTADVVTGPDFAKEINGYSYRTQVGVTGDNYPVVLVPSEDDNYLSFWTPAGWGTPVECPIYRRGKFVTDREGVITAVGKGLNRSFDSGKTWQKYPDIPTSSYGTAFDVNYLRQTHQIRYSNLAEGVVTVYTVKFINNQK